MKNAENRPHQPNQPQDRRETGEPRGLPDRPEPSKEDRIGRHGSPRGENRIFRPIKLYKTAWDVWDEQLFPENTVIHVPSIEELHESPHLPERANVAIRELKEEHRLREKTLSKVTPEERERITLEGMILDLKESGTGMQSVSGKIWDLENGWVWITAETLAKMQKLDPDFMTPIMTALQKRQARLEKAQRAIQRIYQRRAENQPPKKP